MELDEKPIANPDRTGVEPTLRRCIEPLPGHSLPSGTVGKTYSASVSATGGQDPYSWSANGLPSGLTISTAGKVSGAPKQAGTVTVTLTVTDALGHNTLVRLPLSVAATPLIGDINHDGAVDCSDYALLKAAWDWGAGTRAGNPADLNGDKSVDGLDYSIMSSHWTGSTGSC